MVFLWLSYGFPQVSSFSDWFSYGYMDPQFPMSLVIPNMRITLPTTRLVAAGGLHIFGGQTMLGPESAIDVKDRDVAPVPARWYPHSDVGWFINHRNV